MTDVAVSVALAVDRFATGRRTIDALRRQTLAGRLELVLAGPGVELPARARDGLGDISTVEMPARPLSAARAG